MTSNSNHGTTSTKSARNPLRITFVQSSLQAGGAEKVINLLAKHYTELGHDVSVIAFARSAAGSFFPYPGAVKIITMETDQTRGLARAVRRVRFLRSTFKQLAPDVIVSFLTKVNVLTLLAASGMHSQVVIAERNNPLEQDASRVWYHAIKLLGSRAARIVMQTEASLVVLPKRLRGKAVVIPNPVFVPPSPLALAQISRKFVAAGRLEKQKGFDLLLAAFALVLAEYPKSTLNIFGQGPELESLVKLAETLGVAESVFFPGVTNLPGDWVHAGEVFVLSSRFEGFPNVLLEAMAFGMPSVAFECPWGPSEIIDNGKDGILVPTGDVKALARAMSDLLADPVKLKAMGRAAHTSVKKFELDHILAKWDKVITIA